MRTLCIIPARGGSKGVKRKNIRLVGGKPLIAYSIECAQKSKKISFLAVSTEDDEIADVAIEFQSPVIMRPQELAKDETPMLPVLQHALDQLEKEGLTFDLIILLQATSPLRTPDDVDNVISMFEEDASLDGVISVVELHNLHASHMYNIDGEGKMRTVADVNETGNRQHLPPVYYRNGCIYAVRPEAMKREGSIMVKNKKAYIMPAEWWANIDGEKDLLNTENLLKRWKKSHASSENGVTEHI
jgi:CMP-N,N'-diacetyllegionaminic acid synthase